MPLRHTNILLKKVGHTVSLSDVSQRLDACFYVSVLEGNLGNAALEYMG